MEYGGHGVLEELLAIRSDSWEANIPSFGMNLEDFYFNNTNDNNGFFGNTFYDNSASAFLESPPLSQTSSFEDFSLPFFSHQDFYYPFGDHEDQLLLKATPHDHSTPTSHNTIKIESSPLIFDQLSSHEDYSLSMLDDHVQNSHFNAGLPLTQAPVSCKPEPEPQAQPFFNMGLCSERKNVKSKKLDGQPSKNLMAERRRRKRLNDRLSMLRSIVPKISKMDRTSILGDTIDYMKELIERINQMQEEIEVGSSCSNQLKLMSIFKDSKPNEILITNSPKFDVERRNTDTRIEVCCTGKPGLLVSTMTTIEALGLEIQQCVISCFNDFAMQASCSEEMEQRGILSSEDVKQALFRNAGYGGKCL